MIYTDYDGILAQVKIALEQLGYKNFSHHIEHLSFTLHNVYMNGEYLGIWDSRKNTFVD